MLAVKEDREINTAMADAFSKIKIEEVKLTSDKLDNGLSLSMINKLIISNHAKRRGKERFEFKNDVETDTNVRDALKKAKYIGIVPANDGNESHLYVYEKMGIHISLDMLSVNTLLKYGEKYLSEVLNNYEEIKVAFIQYQLKEMKKLTRTRKMLKKKVVEDKLDYNVEIAELDRKIFKSKSGKAKVRYAERKRYLLNEMKIQEENLSHVEQKLRKVGGALAFLNN